MQLLVSVRSAGEVDHAVSGGADIIDAKDPGLGSLGAVSPQTLAEILLRMPPDRTFSVALGDVTTEAEVAAAITSLRVPPRPVPTFLKVGFAGVDSPEAVRGLLSRAVRLAARLPEASRIVAVAYADARRAGTVSPELLFRSARQAGAAGVLIDTYLKDGSGLLDWLSPETLAEWVSQVRRSGLLSAVAGALGPDDLETVQAAAPDVVGVRGAACDGGRSGQVSAWRVAGLRRHLDEALEGRRALSGSPAKGTSQNA